MFLDREGFEGQSRWTEQFYPPRKVLEYNFQAHPARDQMVNYLLNTGEPEENIERLFTWPKNRGGTLTDIGILRHLTAGNVVIHPFDHRLLQPHGYDVRLGDHFYYFRVPDRGQNKNTDKQVYNPFDPEMVSSCWRGISIVIDSEGVLRNISKGDKIMVVSPETMVLGHTEEFIGGRNVITPTISGKSSVGRSMVEVCSDANLGTVGFFSRWTLEIATREAGESVILVVGEPIATIQFEEMVELPLKQYSGEYQEGVTLEEVVAGWRPEVMKPKWRRNFLSS